MRELARFKVGYTQESIQEAKRSNDGELQSIVEVNDRIGI